MIDPERERHIVVNYHYVEDPRDDFSGIHPCSVWEFGRQIEFLASNYSVGTVADVYNAASTGNTRKVCAITFDDGLKDQYSNARPILEKLGLTATFFPITSTLDGVLPSAHKIHILLSKFSALKLIEIFNKFMDGAHIISTSERFGQKPQHKQEDMLVANFKNGVALLAEDSKKAFFNHIFKIAGLREGKLSAELFMSKEDLTGLSRAGFAVDSHSHAHYSHYNTDKIFLEGDISRSLEILKRLTGKSGEVYSYPHGRTNETMASVVKDLGFKYAVTIDNRFARKGDDAYFVPRLDTNALK